MMISLLLTDAAATMSTVAKTILFLTVLAVVTCVALVVYALVTAWQQREDAWDRLHGKR
jgi:hypothetical protein